MPSIPDCNSLKNTIRRKKHPPTSIDDGFQAAQLFLSRGHRYFCLVLCFFTDLCTFSHETRPLFVFTLLIQYFYPSSALTTTASPHRRRAQRDPKLVARMRLRLSESGPCCSMDLFELFGPSCLFALLSRGVFVCLFRPKGCGTRAMFSFAELSNLCVGRRALDEIVVRFNL